MSMINNKTKVLLAYIAIGFIIIYSLNEFFEDLAKFIK